MSFYGKSGFPPRESHTKQIEKFVSYFYLWDCFGIVMNFERLKIDNSGWENWKKQKRMTFNSEHNEKSVED